MPKRYIMQTSKPSLKEEFTDVFSKKVIYRRIRAEILPLEMTIIKIYRRKVAKNMPKCPKISCKK